MLEFRARMIGLRMANSTHDPLKARVEAKWQEAGASNAKLAYINRWAAGNTALDLGTGHGVYARYLADRGFAVTGLDRNPTYSDDRITIVAQDIDDRLPFEDAAFDTVLMFDILEHLPDEAAVLAEVARVCKRRLIISVPHADDGFLPDYSLTYLHRIDRTHEREYTVASLSAALEQHGFHTLACRLEGLPHIPLVFSEFLAGPRWLKTAARYGITALFKLGLVRNTDIAGDVFWAGEKRH